MQQATETRQEPTTTERGPLGSSEAPCYVADCVTLYCADCLSVIPSLSGVDAVVTDPPYGIGKRMQGGTWGAKQKYDDFREWDIAPDDSTLAQIVALSPACIIWGGNYFSLPPSRCWLSWSKVNAVPTMASIELAWTNFDRPAKEWRGQVGVHTTGHPTQKPTPLIAWCLSFLPNGCTVLDPYMGSGTTGIACIRSGRKFIGIERDEKYFDIARNRIEKELAQGRLW